MKKIMTTAFIVLLTIGAAQAQSTGAEKNHPHKKEHRMGDFEQLNLTADQKARLQTLRENFKKQMTELKTQGLSEADMKSRRKELHQSYRAQAGSILTNEQKEQLSKMRAERRASGAKLKGNWPDKRAGNGVHKGFRNGNADLQKELDLSQDQQAKMHQIRSEFQSKFQSLRQDNNLSAEQKKEKMQHLRKEQRQQMKAVLTQDQVKKMQELRKERTNKNTR